jgi:hypothetical protein
MIAPYNGIFKTSRHLGPKSIINMLSRSKILLIVTLFLLCIPVLHAQDIDYLKHGKTFCLCSVKRECSLCLSCDKERYQLKIDNHTQKKIKNVYYKFYSSVFNRILEKEAKIEGNEVRKLQVGVLHICIPDGRHWIISKIVYDDDSADTFILHERMENFLQDADECDCND